MLSARQPLGCCSGILSPHPHHWTSLSHLQEHLEGGLRHCTLMHPILQGSQRHGETIYPVGWQGISQAPACHPPKPATLCQHKRWFLLTVKNRFPSMVFTLPLNASRCPHRMFRASSFGSHRQLHSSPQHPAAGFHQTLFFNTNNLQTVVQGAGRQQRGCSLRGKHHQHRLVCQPQPPSTRQQDGESKNIFMAQT